MVPVRITSWYPNFNGRHFGLPPTSVTGWGLREYVIVHTILPPSPVILCWVANQNGFDRNLDTVLRNVVAKWCEWWRIRTGPICWCACPWVHSLKLLLLFLLLLFCCSCCCCYCCWWSYCSCCCSCCCTDTLKKFMIIRIPLTNERFSWTTDGGTPCQSKPCPHIYKTTASCSTSA